MLPASAIIAQALRACAQGRFADARAELTRVVREEPENVRALNALGAALYGEGAFDEMQRVLTHALTLSPQSPELHNNLGNALRGLGQVQAAQESYQAALRHRPAFEDAHRNLTTLCWARQQWSLALSCARTWAVHCRQSAEPQAHAAVALLSLGKLGRAHAACMQALDLDVRCALAWRTLGELCLRAENLAQATEAFQTALDLAPHDTAALVGLGSAAFERGDFAAARNAYAHAIALGAEDIQCNLGHALAELGDFDGALAAYEQALHKDPGHHQAHFGRAQIRLRRGELTTGFAAFESRPSALRLLALGLPGWDGTPAPGLHLWVFAEQGVGDVIQFARFLGEARARVGELTFCVERTLWPLLHSLPADHFADHYTRGDPVGACVSLASLAGLLGGFGTCPYMEAPVLPESCALPRIGIAHRTSNRTASARRRTVPLELFQKCADVVGPLLSLDPKDAPSAWLRTVPALDHDAPFVQTAALMAELDLVMSCDSAVAHLAGALGRPVWLLLPRVADWRWFEGSTSPWYPTMRIFRQAHDGDWSGVLDEVCVALRHLG